MDQRETRPHDPLYGMPRAQRVLHCSHPTIVKWAREGRFATEFVEGRLYVRRSVLMAFKASRERERAARTQLAVPDADNRLPAA